MTMPTAASYPNLLKDLQGLHKRLVVDFVGQVRQDPQQQARLATRRQASETGMTADAFVDLCAHRAAVQVLLRTVYVRVLEDLGALAAKRIDGEYGLWAFRQVAPSLGVRAWLQLIFKDMAKVLPALFAPAEEELGLPSDAMCQAIWDLWHAKLGTGELRHRFAQEEGVGFDSRFLGDLYQDLDADIRKRFALLQTPGFVEKFILDKTLTPALAEFDPAALRAKGECFRVIDPTCGSGHFLTGSLNRLADWWEAQGCDKWTACERALESVWGCDINAHAVDIARFRLILEVRGRTGVRELEKLAGLRLNLRVLDSLVPWERATGKLQQRSLFGEGEKIDAYGSQEERAANGAFLARDFHVVVGNPPYITPKDAKKRDDYRGFWPDSAAGKYAMSAPFVERLLVLGAAGGFMGQITANSFMKREFGKKLVTTVLPKWDLTGVVDTSGAYIPGHGTPTVILLARCQRAVGKEVWAVQGKRGEPKRPEVAENGLVWSAIVGAGAVADDGSPFVSVARVGRAVFSEHPWSVGGGAIGETLELLNVTGVSVLESVILDSGFFGVPNADEILLHQGGRAILGQLDQGVARSLVNGDCVRDFEASESAIAIVAYEQTGEIIDIHDFPSTHAFLWAWRTTLWDRGTFARTTYKQEGLPWWKWHQIRMDRGRGLGITWVQIL